MTKAVRLLLCLAGLAWSAQAFAQDADPAPVKKNPVPESAAAQPVLPKGVAELQKGRGTLFIKEDTWDFGYVAQDVKITHEFILQNVGSDTLFIERIKPT